MRFDDDAAGPTGRASSVQADSYVLKFRRTIALMEPGRRRGIEEQITPKLERTQNDLVAISCDAEGTS